jgi:hypothetical protein
VRLVDETVWLTLNQMAELFVTTKQNISLHVKNILAEGELSEAATVKEYLTVQQEGKRMVNRNLQYYNLDMIISVGYRVNSHRGTQFRIWATQRLREYIIKGFTLDDERLKRGGAMNYFDELLARIRDIRSSEKVFYQKTQRHPLHQRTRSTGTCRAHQPAIGRGTGGTTIRAVQSPATGSCPPRKPEGIGERPEKPETRQQEEAIMDTIRQDTTEKIRF